MYTNADGNRQSCAHTLPLRSGINKIVACNQSNWFNPIICACAIILTCVSRNKREGVFTLVSACCACSWKQARGLIYTSLCVQGYVKMLRLYTETNEWVALNRGPEADQHPVRAQYLNNLHEKVISVQ